MSIVVYVVTFCVLWIVTAFVFAAYIRSYVKKYLDKVWTADLTDNVRSLESEFNRITDRDIGLFEVKEAAFKELVANADAKTAQFNEVLEAIIAERKALNEARQKMEQAKKEFDAAEKEFGDKPLFEKITALQNKGFSIEEIARKLDKTVSEIALSQAMLS
jgi:lipopolysaccharide export LptBFGC system permease protein LptF